MHLGRTFLRKKKNHRILCKINEKIYAFSVLNARLWHIRPVRALSFSKRYGKLDMYLTPAQNLHVCMHMQLHLS